MGYIGTNCFIQEPGLRLVLERDPDMYNSDIEALAVSQLISDLASPARDCVAIRGVTLPLDELVDRRLFEPARQAALREQLLQASPFPHLVIQGLFNPRFLDLVYEEFDLLPASTWADLKSNYECTRRSVLGARLGAASQLYFDIVNSGWFTEWVSGIIGVPYLLGDPKLWGGGLHESRPGASFGVHRDFVRHRHVGLKNEMVLITYLNKNWQPEWGSALELWDAQQRQCVKQVQPEFGHTLLMPHGPTSYHGHPTPMQTPDGRPRRSVAAYYYTSPHVGKFREDEVSSIFLHISRLDKTKRVAQMVVPPVLWSALRKLAHH